MTKTPEGFLICHNVPIARTGWMKYLGQEVKREDLYDQPVDVYRSPDEVFSPAAIASFEGKSVTDEHPSNWVTPDNYSSYERGQIMNVRQGTDDNSDFLLADLIIKDPTLISEIENGKREVSCGYDHDLESFEDNPDKYQQKNIRGNHVAVVTAGRAGPSVAIKDQKPIVSPTPTKTERRKHMKSSDQKTLWGKVLSAFAKDADPEELAEVAKMGPKDEEEKAKDALSAPAAEPPKPAAPAVDDAPAGDPQIAALAKQIQELQAVISQLVQSDKQVHSEIPKDSLDELVSELETPEQQEQEEQSGAEQQGESVTIPVGDDAPISSPEDRPKNPIPGADRNTMLNAIKAMRPIVAGIKDPAERKQATDALAKSFRDQLTVKPTYPNTGYAGIVNAQQANVAKAKDSKPEDLTDLGRDIAKKHNPHYKEAK